MGSALKDTQVLVLVQLGPLLRCTNMVLGATLLSLSMCSCLPLLPRGLVAVVLNCFLHAFPLVHHVFLLVLHAVLLLSSISVCVINKPENTYMHRFR